MKIRQYSLALLTTVITIPAAAHEYWLDPLDMQWQVGDTLQADIRNGQDFVGTQFPFDPQSISRAGLISESSREPLVGRLGDYPAFQMPLTETGLTLLLLETTRRNLVYEDMPAFETFLDYHAFSGIIERHHQRGLPEKDIVEHYYRYAKALVEVCTDTDTDTDTDADADSVASESSGRLETGQAQDGKIESSTAIAPHPALDQQNQRLELITTKNPFGSESLAVQVLFENAPLADRQIELFHKDESGEVTRRVQQSDDDGFVQFDISAAGDYLVNSVWIEEAPNARAHWKTSWASLFLQQTFCSKPE